VCFYIALHYVDAVFVRHGHSVIRGHPHRLALLVNVPATRDIAAEFIRLYEESKEARYYGTQYSAGDLLTIEPLFNRIRNRMRLELGLP
jgi:hypothetical protein